MDALSSKIVAIKKTLAKDLGIENPYAVPAFEKVVVGAGVGKMADKKKRELVFERITKITGQQPVWTKAKKSIASFKLREGEAIGVKVTLRGERMYDFIDKLVHVALPRMRDFKGISDSSIDSMGNITIGISEHTIFPETADEDLRDVFGLSITIGTTGKDTKGAQALLAAIGFPFTKDEVKKGKK